MGIREDDLKEKNDLEQKMGKYAEKPKIITTRVYCDVPLAILVEVTSSNVTPGF